MERGNLRADVKGEFQVEEPQETEYRCSHRGRLSRSSNEALVMRVERRARVI